MNNCYRTAFTINSVETPGLALFSQVEEFMRDWAHERFACGQLGDRQLTTWKTENETVTIDRGEVDDSAFFSLSVRRSVGWLLGFRLAVKGDIVEAEIDVRRPDDSSMNHEGGIQAAAPTFLSDLVRYFDCNLGGESISADVVRVSLTDDLPLVRNEVYNPSRQFPLVLVTGATTKYAEFWQSRLIGLASVLACDSSIDEHMSDELRPHLCYRGAVRIYMPNYSKSDHRSSHPLWMPDRVRELGAALWTELREVCMSHLALRTFPMLYDQVSKSVRATEHQELLSRLKNGSHDMTAADELFDDLQNREIKLQQREVELQAQIRDYKDENDSLRTDNFNLRSQLDQYRDTLAYDIGSQLNVQEYTQKFSNVLDVVNKAKNVLSNLRFLPSAGESASESKFPRPNEVWKVFKALDECADARKRGNIGKDMEEWFYEKGLDYSPHESQATMNKYGRWFYDPDQGERLEMPAHFKLGGGRGGNNQLRVHVGWEEHNEMWVVGHVGSHLPTDSS